MSPALVTLRRLMSRSTDNKVRPPIGQRQDTGDKSLIRRIIDVAAAEREEVSTSSIGRVEDSLHT